MFSEAIGVNLGTQCIADSAAATKSLSASLSRMPSPPNYLYILDASSEISVGNYVASGCSLPTL